MKNIQNNSLDTLQKTTAQNKIRNCIILYKRTFPDDYETVVYEIANRRKLNVDKFASLKGDHAIQRALFEIPETLMVGILANLDEHQMGYFKSIEGSRWFAKTFRQFAVGNEV